MDEKAMLALALKLAERLNELGRGDSDVYICVHPGEDCPESMLGEDNFNYDCDRCLANYLLPVLREELGATK